MLFDIDGKAEVRNATNSEPQDSQTQPAAGGDQAGERSPDFIKPQDKNVDKLKDKNVDKLNPEAFVVKKLNEEAEAICDRIERGLKKHLPPYLTVQANIQFEQGSLLITGTVAIFAWAGSVALEATKAEIQQQIANLVKSVVGRVINRAVASLSLSSDVSSMEMTVRPQLFTGSSLANQAGAKTTPGAKSVFPLHRHVYVLYALFAIVLVVFTLSKYIAIRLR
jgi:hypothetical protein